MQPFLLLVETDGVVFILAFLIILIYYLNGKEKNTLYSNSFVQGKEGLSKHIDNISIWLYSNTLLPKDVCNSNNWDEITFLFYLKDHLIKLRKGNIEKEEKIDMLLSFKEIESEQGLDKLLVSRDKKKIKPPKVFIDLDLHDDKD